MKLIQLDAPLRLTNGGPECSGGLQSEARRQISQILFDKLCLRIIGNKAAEDSRKKKKRELPNVLPNMVQVSQRCLFSLLET